MADVGDLIVDRYRLVSKVGSGAMGVVWHARDTVLDRDVALKELLILAGMTEEQTDEAQRRAMREARIAARLHHPHAITVYDVIEHESRPALIMEYLPSRSLADFIDDGTVLPPERLARIGSHIAGALAAAHNAGIVHRDVKPANVLLAEDGTAKLTDFGISRAVGDTTVTATGILAGTPAYLAPEVAQGHDPTWRGDVYSLGATLYTAAEGEPPHGFDDNPMAMLNKVVNDEMTPPTQSGPLTAALLSMLNRDPDRRPTARTVSQLLGAVADGAQAANRPDDPPAAVVPLPASTANLRTPSSTQLPAAAPAPEPAPADPVEAAPPVEPKEPAAVEPGQADRRRRGLILAGLVAAVLVITGTVVAIALNSGGGSTSTAGGPAGHPTTTSSAPVMSTNSPAQPTTAASTSPTAAVNTAPNTTAPSVSVNPPVDVAGQLVSTITQYYGMLPGNLSVAWNWMTQNYQQNHAKSWSYYTWYWGQFSKVTATNVSATLPSTVKAVITYYWKNGTVQPENTTFGLVQQDGQWKIDTSVG